MHNTERRNTYSRSTCTKKTLIDTHTHTHTHTHTSSAHVHTAMQSSKHTYMSALSFLILLVPLEAVQHSLCNPTSAKYAPRQTKAYFIISRE